MTYENIVPKDMKKLVIVSIVVVVSLFAVVVLLLLRRHIQLEGREGEIFNFHPKIS